MEEDGREATQVSILGWQGAHDLSYECWVWNAVRRKKNGSCPGLNGWRGWEDHGGGRRFRGGCGSGGRQLGVWQAEKMNRVASNGSQESTDPNCSFRLQDPRGIQGLEGRFRVRTRFVGSSARGRLPPRQPPCAPPPRGRRRQ